MRTSEEAARRGARAAARRARDARLHSNIAACYCVTGPAGRTCGPRMRDQTPPGGVLTKLVFHLASAYYSDNGEVAEVAFRERTRRAVTR